ncbi:lipopolysaccharide biosynthesis protein [Planococcus lenghuensis]|uniref:Polysaccharide biosynthesis protein n=1 Tax=Planococcus lenghuensis TaxID=2213202 RepID=A0A1Q2L5F3_9BACL|nr:oligosaccharide flippase family protein [Planococcus lenghuensis]AQQ55142.1 hypothetical protein B0X71_14550 [Planococcus lenghuensis]
MAELLFDRTKVKISLKKNILWVFLGNLVYAICQWGILISITKLGSPEIVGQYALGLAIAAPYFIFFNMNLRTVMVTYQTEKYAFREYLTLRIMMLIVALLVSFISSLFFTLNLVTLAVVLLVSLSKLVESISDIFHGTFQSMEKMRLIAVSKILKGIISLFVIVFFMYQTGNLLVALAGLVLSWLAILFFYDYKACFSVLVSSMPKNNRQKYKIYWTRKNLKELLSISVPLGVVAGLDSLHLNVPRYFIEHLYGEEMLGFFVAVTYLMVIGSTIIGAIGQAVLPRLSILYSNKEFNAFIKFTFSFIVFSFIIGLFGVLISVIIGKEALALIYSPEYAAFSTTLNWTMVAATIWYVSSAVGTSINATRQFIAQIPIYMLMTGACSLSSYFLIPAFGLPGGAMALCIGMMVRLVISLFILQRNISIVRNKGVQV